ncbi:MAG TPA: nitronate monooxygenase, partial [Capillimicrobium sp.]
MAGVLQRLAVPVVQAPMAGGPSTPALARATIEAGGLGFVAAGYRWPADLEGELDELRARTDGPLAVNLFADPGPPADGEAVRRYAAELAADGRTPGAPRHDDDALEAKLDVVCARRPDAVS